MLTQGWVVVVACDSKPDIAYGPWREGAQAEQYKAFHEEHYPNDRETLTVLQVVDPGMTVGAT